jgi:hypothetical protein
LDNKQWSPATREETENKEGSQNNQSTNDIAWKNKYVLEEASLNILEWALDP